MQSFTDTTGQRWIVRIDVDCVRRSRAVLGVDLMQLAGGELMQRLSDDPVLLCDLLYLACKPEADDRGITDAQFGSRLGGDSLDQATEAFLAAMVDFLPESQRRLLRTARDKVRAGTQAAIELAQARIEAIDPVAEATKAFHDQAPTNELPPIESSPSATATPAPSASTPPV